MGLTIEDHEKNVTLIRHELNLYIND